MDSDIKDLSTVSDSAMAILDAAERRMRVAGFDGFSFRDIATDIGVKSSSVHYHFRTKEDLAAAVIHRYADGVSEWIDREWAHDPDPVRVWTHLFRTTLVARKQMCPATVLGATASALPAEVITEIKTFFRACLDKLSEQGMSCDDATRFLSTLVGALVVANALAEPAVYDQATRAR